MTELDTLDEIRACKDSGSYAPMDRYSDFRAVFMQDEQGRRVLYEILSWCGMFRTPINDAGVLDQGRLVVHAGMHNIGIRLLNTIHEEPVDRPSTATNVKPEETP